LVWKSWWLQVGCCVALKQFSSCEQEVGEVQGVGLVCVVAVLPLVVVDALRSA